MKAKGVLLASVAGTIAAPVAATAADMPVKAAPKAAAAPVVAAVPSWAGLYVGVHAGVAWHKSQANQNDPDYYGPLSLENSKSGFIGGGQIGYNFQFSNIVAGIEGDISGLDAKTKASQTVFFDLPPQRTSTATSDINWMATLRGRLGLTSGNLLVFVTGGVAWAEIENKWVNVQDFYSGSGATWHQKKTRTAGVFGGGAEYMFTPNWTGRLEALWADFGDTTIKNGRFSSGGVNTAKPTTFKNQLFVVRGAINYKF